MQNFETRIHEVKRSSDLLKTELIEAIGKLPDNEKIKRLSKSPKTFVVKSSDISECWSAFYHDFYSQYEKIIKEIEKLPVEKIVPFLRSVTNERNHYRNVKVGSNFVRFHPQVLKNIRKLMQWE